MINFLRYQISKTHGFCIDYQPECSLPGLSEHIALLKALPNLNPNDIHTLPEYKLPHNLTYPQQELVFLVHLMLNSAYYWQNESPTVPIPKNLSIPTLQLSQILQRPPIINLASVQYHNWKLIDESKPFHPNNIECIFSFSGTRDESNFYHCANYIEHLGAPIIFSAFDLHSTTNYLKPLQAIYKALQDIRTGLALLQATVDPTTFYFGFRKKIRSFEKGLVFEDHPPLTTPLQGASAVQSPLLKLIDAILGITHNSKYMDSVEIYLKKPHQDFLNFVKKNKFNSDIKSQIMKSDSETIETWNKVVMEVWNFRHDHVGLTEKFIIGPSGMSNSKGTGGSSLTEFLDGMCDDTKKLLI